MLLSLTYALVLMDWVRKVDFQGPLLLIMFERVTVMISLLYLYLYIINRKYLFEKSTNIYTNIIIISNWFFFFFFVCVCNLCSKPD